MAEEKIKHSDLIEEGVFEPTIEQAHELLQSVDKLEEGFRALLSTTGKFLSATKQPTNTADLEKLAEQIEKIHQAEQALTTIEKKKFQAEQQLEKLNRDKIKTQQESERLAQQKIKTESTNLRLTQQIASANAKRVQGEKFMSQAYRQQTQELNDLIQRYFQLAATGRENGRVARGLLTAIQEQDTKVKALDASVGRHQRNVGNYTSALKGLSGILRSVANAFGVDTTFLTEFHSVLRETQRGLKEIQHGLSGTTAAMNTQSKAQEILNKVKSAGLGVIALSIAALAGLIAVLITYGDKLFGLTETEKDYQRSIDGTTIANKELRQEHARNVIELQKLQNEYLLTTGAISEFQKAVMDLQADYELAMFNIKQDTQEQLIEARGFWNKFFTGLKSFGQSSFAAQQEKEFEILAQGQFKQQEEKKKHLAQLKLIEAKENVRRNEELKKSFEEGKAFGDKIAELEDEAAKRRHDKLVEELKKRREEIEKEAQEALKTLNRAAQKEAQEAADLLDKEKKERNKFLKEAGKSEINLKILQLEEERDKLKKNTQFSKEELLFIDKIFNDKIFELEKEAARKRTDITEKEAEEKKKQKEEKLAERKKQLEEEIDKVTETQKLILDSVSKGLEQRKAKQQEAINNELTQIDQSIQQQRDLATKGLSNTLAFEEKERAKALEKKQRLEKQAQRQEEAIKLAGIFLEFLKEYIKDGKEAASARALAQTLVAEGITRAIAGRFAEGVEGFEGKGTETSDSNLIAISKNESIVTAKGTNMNPGLVTAMNKGLVDDYFKLNYLPKLNAISDDKKELQTQKALVTVLVSQLDSLKKTIRDKKELSVNWNEYGEMVTREIENGITKITTKRKRWF